MIFLAIAFLAGVLTVLAPCILPLLPIIIGASEGDGRRISRRAIVVISSLCASVAVFTLLLKASTALIDIPQSFWNALSGTMVLLVGLVIAFPTLWAKIPLVSRISQASNQAVGSGYQKKSIWGDVTIGAALGPVFSTCSPTYLFIVATALPVSYATGLLYLIGFIAGLALALLAIAYFGERLVGRLVARIGTAEKVKRGLGILIVIVGLAIMTGYDKKFEAWILNSGYEATVGLENDLIERFTPESLR